MASVSSRSQGQDDSVSETGDQPDDASQQSGIGVFSQVGYETDMYCLFGS